MNNQVLVDYISKQRSAGVSDAEIRNKLVANNWNPSVIEPYFIIEPEKKVSMSGILLLFKTSLTLYKERFSSLIPISLVQFLPLLLIAPLLIYFQDINVFLLQYLANGGNTTNLILGFVGLVTLVSLIFIVIQTWSLAALFYEVTSSTKAGLINAFRESWKNIKPFWWAGSLVSILVAGGSVFIFIPGVIYSVWYLFALYVVTMFGYKGMKSLIVSREYVRGFYFKILIRTIFLGAIYLTISFLLDQIITGTGLNKTFLGSGIILVFNTLSAPLLSIYVYLMFKDLVGIKGKIDLQVTPLMKLKYMWLGVIGFVVPFIAIPAVLLSINPLGQMEKARELNDRNIIISLENSLNLYKESNGTYPDDFSQMIPVYLKKMPTASDTSKCFVGHIEPDETVTVTLSFIDESECNKVVRDQ